MTMALQGKFVVNNRKRPAMAPRGVPAGDQAVIGAQR
jgi:hypothetical protein